MIEVPLLPCPLALGAVGRISEVATCAATDESLDQVALVVCGVSGSHVSSTAVLQAGKSVEGAGAS